ncbi:hypothetical protein [Ferroacidibacillus organovorans]|uniref:SLH domain-containing protein n=1 Tax=Ferroacidibacillus organovorans TaxID=1765683 RepID=A0A101XQR4_9BACL|nr:hypothetical protein [Ferroacidibacillus organovorans]KUO95819.1 hypothetical protein ATW55_15095 [Ferroacidibacillus organovorans]
MRKAAVGFITSILALSLSAGTSVSAASIGQGVTSASTRMVLGGVDGSNPMHLIRKESSTSEPTSWLPVWYLFGVLSKLGIQSTWDGRHWNLQLPSGIQADLSHLPKVPSNADDISIQMDGATVEVAPRFVHRDLSGSVMTSYIPIWYLMQALDRIGVTSTWDGTTWSMSTGAKSVTKMTVAKNFAAALQIAPDSTGNNPFDDVSAPDWPYVNALVQKGYFTPDSSTHFGASDSIDVQAVDHAYQLYVGIPDSDLSWNAGGSTVAWANAIQLNRGVKVGTLTTTSESQITTNLDALYHGYAMGTDGSVHVWFQPYDAKVAFAHNPDVTATMASVGQANSFRLVDEITFSEEGGGMQFFDLPWLSDQNKMEITCGSLYNPSGNHTEYRLNRGGTWATANGFYGYDSRDPQNGGATITASEVMVRTQGHAEIGVSEIFPTHDITFAQVDFSSPSTTKIEIQDSSGQPAWHG